MDSRLTFLILLLATCTLAQENPGVGDAPTSFEKFFDAVLKAVIKKKIDVLEPLHVDDLKITLQPTIRRFKLPAVGTIFATNNTLHGASTIHRSGHASVKLASLSRFTKVQMALGPLQVTSNLRICATGLTLRPTADISVSNLDFTIEIFGNKTAQVLKTTMFTINEMKDLKVSLKQFKWTDPLENLIINRVVPLLENKIRTELESTVKGSVDDKMQQLPDELKRLLYG